MKDLIISKRNKNNPTIDLYEIHYNFSGIIIAYKKDIPFCYIVFDSQEGMWDAKINIDYYDCFLTDGDLYKLIERLKTDSEVTNFKVLEFGN